MSGLDSSRGAAQQLVDVLVAERPAFHVGSAGPRTANWHLGEPGLRLLADLLQPGWVTVETGCGYSTVLFAAAQTRHTVISPSASEHDAVREWAVAHQIDVGGLTFLDLPSHRALADRSPAPLDLVLVDGNHAFPVPLVDWFLTADDVVRGGLVVVDDTQLPAPGVLASFLGQDAEHWELAHWAGDTMAFRKRIDGPVSQLADNYLGWKRHPARERLAAFERRARRALARSRRRSSI